MKQVSLVMMCLILVLDASSQNKYPTLDSFEHSFQSVWKDIKMPCQWNMTAKRKANGKLIFFDTDSTGLEFEFLKASSLPFYTSSQTDFETTERYYRWTIKQRRIKKTVVLTKLEASKEAGFVILKVQDASGMFYRLLARHDDLVCSIKIFNREMPVEKQFEKLKLLHDLNRH